MGSKKALVLIAVVVLVGAAVLLTNQSEDEKVVRELQRRQSQSAPEVSLDATGDEFQPDSFELPGELVAERVPMRNTWFVRGDQELTFIELPFAPPVDAELPSPSGASAEADYESQNPGFVGAATCAECGAYGLFEVTVDSGPIPAICRRCGHRWVIQ